MLSGINCCSYVADLKQPEKWASYLIVRYESSPPSINVTFHQADDIAEKNDWKFFYKIELLRMRAPANHSPWEMFDEKKIGHIQERGLERTVMFNNVSSGVYYVRLQVNPYKMFSKIMFNSVK